MFILTYSSFKFSRQINKKHIKTVHFKLIKVLLSFFTLFISSLFLFFLNLLQIILDNLVYNSKIKNYLKCLKVHIVLSYFYFLIRDRLHFFTFIKSPYMNKLYLIIYNMIIKIYLIALRQLTSILLSNFCISINAFSKVY